MRQNFYHKDKDVFTAYLAQSDQPVKPADEKTGFLHSIGFRNQF